jgi:hypothetical protein
VEFILQNSEVLQTKTFQELERGLQDELEDLVTWDQKAMGCGGGLGDRPASTVTTTTTGSGFQDSFTGELHDMTARMRLRSDVSRSRVAS